MSKKKILVIDDEVELVEAVKIRLESEGYEVLPAYDGDEGLKKIEEEKPDLIILDIVMPQMDGYTFTKEIKSNPDAKDLPIIILTARDKMEDLFGIEGVTEYIVKPFDHRDLLDRIRKLLNEKKDV